MVPESKKSMGSIEGSDADAKRRAEEFYEYFANIGKYTFERSQADLLNNVCLQNSNPLILDNSNKFRPQPVDMSTLILAIKNLKPTNSCGSDGIQLRFLIDSLPVVVFYILVIINTSIVTGVYPDSWKHSCVIPIFKGGNDEEVGNYRPISLLSILSKVLEKIVANQLMNFLESNHLLTDEQHGFRSGLSTETALLKVTNNIYENIENKRISLLLLLDLSKAFDSVHHHILISKLMKMNIDPFWFTNYLCNRVQSVRIGSVSSSPLNVSFGVPQGSILGPLLFLTYVNDLPQNVHDCLLVMYADDTQIMLTGDINSVDDLTRRAGNVLITVKNYFNNNGLLINENKTQFIFFGSRPYISRISENINIQFNNATLFPAQTIKNLGVYMDCTMTFSAHIDAMNKKLFGILLYLNRVCNNFESDCRVMVVQSLVLGILNYCLCIWGSANKSQMERVQRLQNFAAKVAIGGARKYDHVTPILKKLKWLRMDRKFFYDVCILIFKIRNKILPAYLFSLPTVGQIRNENINTRHLNSLHIPRTFTEAGAKNLKVKGPTYWNSLPANIRDCQTIRSFKTHLSEHLLSK